MLKNILALSNTLSREEQKLINGGAATALQLAGDGDKQVGELCLQGSSLPHLSCGPGLSCVGGRVGLCAVEV
ncbi:hypothetical protein [Aquimarina megaterium]|uniref:hypothetical protein n=1 Tax=Aquimarina megaterium TaxID=1443666 RepID=UPI000471A48B|nr:hypothetical protein [Aquimarina megaterium]